MSNLPELLAHVQSHPESTQSLHELVDTFLAQTTSAEDRQAIRQAAVEPDVTLACETLYFDGVGMAQPEHFVRQTIAALFMTGGYSHRDTAGRIMGELRVFADHHQVDYPAQLAAIRALPGTQRSPRNRRRLLLVNAVLFACLVVGTLAVQTVADPLRLILQLAVLLAVIGTQMAVLYRYFLS